MGDHEAFFGANPVPSLDDIFAAAPPPEFHPPAMGDLDLSGDFRSVWNPVGEAGPSSFPAIQSWNAAPAFDCNFCQVLRTITHVHYGYNCQMKLEIHGGLGLISHAILEKKIASDHNSASNAQFETLDFSEKSIWDVKQILGQYCWERSEDGYTNISNDPLLLFYEALCAGAADNQNSNINNNIPAQPEPEPEPQQQQEAMEQPGDENKIKKSKSNDNNDVVRVPLSEQRKRTATLTVKDLSEFFHMALGDAAKSLEVCSTVLKKICRRDGIPRWPYRKVDSVKKKIEALQQNLCSRHAAVRADAREKINKLRQEASAACGGFVVL